MSSSDTAVPDRPTGPPKEWTLEELKTHLQWACALELATIPLYLYALYSIIDSGSAKGKILDVVKQEMLHLALAGNCLCAIGGQPKLYDATVVPEYPSELFYSKLPLNLQQASKEQLETFMGVEHPESSKLPQPRAGWFLPTYGSIGEFYNGMKKGCAAVDEKQHIFTGNTSGQFTPDDNIWFDDGLTPVTDIKTANTALDTVIEQGEGNPGGSIPGGEESHYQAFKELHDGEPLKCYTLMKNPKTKDCQGHPAHDVMLACDAVYCYLLLTMEKCWTCKDASKRTDLTSNIMSLMTGILKPMAKWMVKQKFEGFETVGPPFNYYEFSSHQSALGEVQKLMGTAATKFPDLKPAQKAAANLTDVGGL